MPKRLGFESLFGSKESRSLIQSFDFIKFGFMLAPTRFGWFAVAVTSLPFFFYRRASWDKFNPRFGMHHSSFLQYF